MHKKDIAIETGNVGATAAQFLAEKELYDMVLVNIVAGFPQGKAFDLTEAALIESYVEKACPKLKNRRKPETPNATYDPKRRFTIKRRLSVECAKPGLLTRS